MESEIPEQPLSLVQKHLQELLDKKIKELGNAVKEEEWALDAYNRRIAARILIEEDICDIEDAIETLEENL